MIRRRPFELPHPGEVTSLAALLGDAPRDALADRGVDDEVLVEAALAHGLGPQLAAAIERERVGLAAPAVERLGKAVAMRLARAAALRAELDELGEALSAACGARPICVKGPAVADRLYAEPSERPFGDLDLLVPRERLADAASALAALGWHEDVEFASDFAARFGHELHLRRRRGGIWLLCELHWRIGDDPLCEALDHALLERDARPLHPHHDVLAPSPSADLLILCVHFLGDRERRLIWIGDIARATRALDQQGWSETFALADRLGLGWALDRGLDYAERYANLRRARPRGPADPPKFGPLRAVEELDMRASLHVGRLAALRGRERLRYLRTILVPSGAGLDGTAGIDGAPRWRAVARHLRSAIAGVLPRR